MVLKKPTGASPTSSCSWPEVKVATMQSQETFLSPQFMEVNRKATPTVDGGLPSSTGSLAPRIIWWH